MYQIGDLVVYGIHGVCRIAQQEERIVDKKTVTYLALEPVGQGGSRYLVPTYNAAAMSKLRHILSKEELEELIGAETIHEDCWICDENLRKQTYRELINSGDCTKLIQMVYTLYRHKATQAAAGRKFHMCDENFLRDAEKLLISEAEIVLELDRESAKIFLKERLKVQ